MILQTGLLVKFPEEFGVGEPRGEDFFIPRNYCFAAIAGVDIRRADELGGKLFLPVAKRWGGGSRNG